MRYRCTNDGCGHELEYDMQLAVCNQCGQPWAPVDDETEPLTFDEWPMNDNRRPTHTSNEPSADAVGLHLESHDATGTSHSGPWDAPPQPIHAHQPSFSLEAGMHSIALTPERLSLLVRIRAASDAAPQATGWLAQAGRVNGPSVRFRSSADPAFYVAPLEFPDFPASGGVVYIRIDAGDTGRAFWQGFLNVESQSDGIVVNVSNDRITEGGHYLGGLNDGVVVNVHDQSTAERWAAVPLFVCGPKRIDNQCRRRPNNADQVFARPNARPSESARLTLLQSLADGRERYVNLVVGTDLRIGRNKTPDRPDDVANDVYLRTLSDDAYDDYISRYQGAFRFTEHGLEFRNLSRHGTCVGRRTLQPNASPIRLQGGITLRPVCEPIEAEAEALGLRAQVLESGHDTDSYELLVTDWGLQAPPLRPVGTDTELILKRTDRLTDLETYIFFQNMILVGSSSSCAWRIADESIRGLHAIVVWMDGSFWIESHSDAGEVRVAGRRLVPDHVVRLQPHTVIQLGDLEFTVAPDWRQHITHCDPQTCCTGHGDECHCVRCVAVRISR